MALITHKEYKIEKNRKALAELSFLLCLKTRILNVKEIIIAGIYEYNKRSGATFSDISDEYSSPSAQYPDTLRYLKICKNSKSII